LSSGLTLSFFTSANAWLFTVVWSPTICWVPGDGMRGLRVDRVQNKSPHR
jgi:hypothetical protein